MKDVIEEIIDEPIYNNSEDIVDLNEYNLNKVKVKNIGHIWRLFVITKCPVRARQVQVHEFAAVSQAFYD